MEEYLTGRKPTSTDAAILTPVAIRRETAQIKGRTFMVCPCDSVNKSFVAVCEGEEGEEWQNIVLSSTCVWKGLTETFGV